MAEIRIFLAFGRNGSLKMVYGGGPKPRAKTTRRAKTTLLKETPNGLFGQSQTGGPLPSAFLPPPPRRDDEAPPTAECRCTGRRRRNGCETSTHALKCFRKRQKVGPLSVESTFGKFRFPQVSRAAESRCNKSALVEYAKARYKPAGSPAGVA